MPINPNHCVSQKVAQQLIDAEIVFNKSPIVWYRDYMDIPKNEIYPAFKGWSNWELEEREDVYKTDQTLKIIEIFPAPSLMEILDRLPDSIELNNKYYYILMSKEGGWAIWYYNPVECEDILAQEANTAPDAAALMLIKVINET
jgi:hypothetical protein